MTGLVLITRPHPAAALLRTALALRGLGAVLAPLLQQQPVALSPAPTDYQAVLLTSSAALDYLPREALLPSWADLPCYCVGQTTARQAARYGWRNVLCAAGDAKALAALIIAQHPTPITLLHPCGHDHRAEPMATLQAVGQRVAAWVVYQAEAVSTLPVAALTALQTNQLFAVTFFSPRTAQIFTDLVRAAQLEAHCASVAAVCLSPQIATAAQGLPWQTIISAPIPEEAALLTCLQNLLRR